MNNSNLFRRFLTQREGVIFKPVCNNFHKERRYRYLSRLLPQPAELHPEARGADLLWAIWRLAAGHSWFLGQGLDTTASPITTFQTMFSF